LSHSHDPATHGLDHYLVGGAVRDIILGKTPKDRDYVVINATPEDMLARGFVAVGSDFPVFLHPEAKSEYALARTERKSGRGYQGFVVSTDGVTLREDLSRRDLTMNAMAMTADGTIIDPFNGRSDLQDGILRHVGPAFAEDPLRVLRVARFAAQTGFTIAPETATLGRFLARAGELDTLTPERVAGEMTKALDGAKPSRFFQALDQMDALHRLFPEVAALKDQTQPIQHHAEGDAYIHTLLVLDAAAPDPLTRFCALAHDLGKGVTPKDLLPKHHGHEAAGAPIAKALAERLKLPTRYAELAAKSARWHTHVHRTDELTPQSFVRLFDDNGGINRLGDLEMVAAVAVADFEGHRSALRDQHPHLTHARARRFMSVVTEIGKVRAHHFADPDQIRAMGAEKLKIKLHEARINAAKTAMRQFVHQDTHLGR